MSSQSNRGRRWLKAVPITVIVLCATVFLLLGRSMTVPELAGWLSQNKAAAGIVILMYALKSLTVIWPLLSLYLISGFLFPAPIAILVNLLGLVAWATVPYLLGRLLGSGELDRLRERYPKLRLLETLRRKSGFQFAVLSRSVGVLPGDIVSLYFGCEKLPYLAYLAGSVLGILPGMIAATIFGGQIEDPGSPGFWISAAAGLVVTLVSFLACRRTVKRERGQI